MTDPERTNAEPGKADETGPSGPSAADDLAEGLGLILRAARRAIGQVDPRRIEEAGQRAAQELGRLDRDKLGEMGRRAVKNFDPSKVESAAQDAGRELVNVVDRLAERIEAFVSEVQRRSSPDEPDEPKSKPRPRVRIDDDN